MSTLRDPDLVAAARERPPAHDLLVPRVPGRPDVTTIAVTVTALPRGWRCAVRLTDADGSSTDHEVAVSEADLQRLAPGARDPADLVRRSFEFLLAREPKASILRSFELPVIGRYFPEYEREIRG